MAPKTKPKQDRDKKLQEYSEDDFTGQDFHKRYLKVPTYTKNFPRIVSRVSYEGFLSHGAQLNGGLLPFATRTLVEQAWIDLLHEKFNAWETAHSETIKRNALNNGLSQIETNLFQGYCQPRAETQPSRFEEPHMIFIPIPSKPGHLQYIKHPEKAFRIIEIPEELRILAKDTQQESRKRGRPRHDNDDGEDDDSVYDTSSTMKPSVAKPNKTGVKRGRYKKKAKTESTAGDDA